MEFGQDFWRVWLKYVDFFCSIYLLLYLIVVYFSRVILNRSSTTWMWLWHRKTNIIYRIERVKWIISAEFTVWIWKIKRSAAKMTNRRVPIRVRTLTIIRSIWKRTGRIFGDWKQSLNLFICLLVYLLVATTIHFFEPLMQLFFYLKKKFWIPFNSWPFNIRKIFRFFVFCFNLNKVFICIHFLFKYIRHW